MGKVVVGVVGRLVRNGTTEYTAVVQDAREHGSDADGHAGIRVSVVGGGTVTYGGGGGRGSGSDTSTDTTDADNDRGELCPFLGGRKEGGGGHFLSDPAVLGVCSFFSFFFYPHKRWLGGGGEGGFMRLKLRSLFKEKSKQDLILEFICHQRFVISLKFRLINPIPTSPSPSP